MSKKVCPKCGATQEWEMWRRCACGYDFGATDQPKVLPETRPTAAEAEKQAQLEIVADIESLRLPKADERWVKAMASRDLLRTAAVSYIGMILIGLCNMMLWFGTYRDTFDLRTQARQAEQEFHSETRLATPGHSSEKTITVTTANAYVRATELFYLGAFSVLLCGVFCLLGLKDRKERRLVRELIRRAAHR